jgi:hypothetical protein
MPRAYRTLADEAGSGEVVNKGVPESDAIQRVRIDDIVVEYNG